MMTQVVMVVVEVRDEGVQQGGTHMITTQDRQDKTSLAGKLALCNTYLIIQGSKSTVQEEAFCKNKI